MVKTVPLVPTADSLTQKNNCIQVSNTKKPLFFYVNLAKVSITHIRFLGWLQLFTLISPTSIGFISHVFPVLIRSYAVTLTVPFANVCSGT